MMELTAYHQLGKFIVSFQHVERQINDIILLIAGSDDEFVYILINELDYSERIRTMDVMFARFADLRTNIGEQEKSLFHSMVVSAGKLCERRNELVHSKYYEWANVEEKYGLLRQNSKLRGNKGLREESEEEMLPSSFNDDLAKVDIVYENLEQYRLKIIDWLYPAQPT